MHSDLMWQTALARQADLHRAADAERTFPPLELRAAQIRRYDTRRRGLRKLLPYRPEGKQLAAEHVDTPAMCRSEQSACA